jgi:hypothetical protein
MGGGAIPLRVPGVDSGRGLSQLLTMYPFLFFPFFLAVQACTISVQYIVGNI